MISRLAARLSSFKGITYEPGANAVLTMNTPKGLNCLSSDMKAELVAALRQAESDPHTRALTLLSAVPKAFCAGANIKDFTHKASKDFLLNDIFEELAYTFAQSKKPIIAGVNGLALGGGFELALLCDVILCSKDAQFGLPEVKLGLIPGIGGTQRFPKVVGKYTAMRYILTGDLIPADRALQLHLVSEVHPDLETLHKEAKALGSRIAKFSPSTLIAAKASIRLSEELGVSAGVRQERQIFYPLFDTKNTQEGINAFVEKREAKFDD
jgi:enoyl-CoA hydratase